MQEATWFEDWCKKNVHPDPYADVDEARELADKAEKAADAEGVSIKTALEQLDYSDLEALILRWPKGRPTTG